MLTRNQEFQRTLRQRSRNLAVRRQRRSGRQVQIDSTHWPTRKDPTLSATSSTFKTPSVVPPPCREVASLLLGTSTTATTTTSKKKTHSKRPKKTHSRSNTADTLSLLLATKTTVSRATPRTMTGTDDKKSTTACNHEATMADAKKKRTAERQITKDDNHDEDDEDNVVEGQSFKKADAQVLASRRIIKARRPSQSAGANKTGTSNPFAKTVLTKAGNSNGTTTASASSTSSTAKVFGAGFAGFGAVAAKAADGAGFGVPTATGISSGFGGSYAGFVTAAPSGGFGFGGAAATTTTKAGGDTHTSAAFTVPSFGMWATSGKETSKVQGVTVAAPATTTTIAAQPSSPPVKLPEQVKLTTGEEEEIVLFELRCRSHKWVDGPAAATVSTSSTAVITTPSVPPSSSPFATMNKPKASHDNKEGEEKDANDKPNAAKDDSNKKQSTVATTDSDSSSHFRWKEVGMGPLRVLKEKHSPKVRLVQRRESSTNGPATKLLINEPLWREAHIEKQSDKHVTFSFPHAGTGIERYSFKFNTSEEATQLYDILIQHKKHAKSCVGGNTDDEKKTNDDDDKKENA